MTEKSWNLVAVQMLGEAFQDKFPVPTKAMIAPLEKGHKAKLMFENSGGERSRNSLEPLWVEILLVQGDQYLGQLEDDPNCIPELKRGEMIEFKECHIIETE